MPTPAGPVQIGLPPETIKDAIALGLEHPSIYVVPPELFDRRRGLSLAEIEFPAYYNYFILKRRIRLVVEDERTATRLRTMMRESLFASRPETDPEEFAPSYPALARPDFAREMDHFRRGADGRCRDVDDLLDFVVLDGGRCTLDGRIELRRREAAPSERAGVEAAPHDRASLEGPVYELRVDGTLCATVPALVELPEKLLPSQARVSSFEPPDFGITVLGASHGFDAAGKTTGFLLWIGGRGILIDPPVDTTPHLREHGVMPKVIDGVVLTHCHADHDSGVFAKLLEEGRTRLYTTPTILRSFLRKYSALSDIAEEDLRRTFSFTPAKIGQATVINGAELYFFYTLHSIPTIGFEVFYGGKSLVFSSDTLYDPAAIDALAEKGVLTRERRDALVDFPFHHTVVLHEAGVPPLHTPLGPLAALPDSVKERLWLVHIAKKDVPPELGLKSAEVGLDATLRIQVDKPAYAEAMELLNVFCSIDFFRELPLSRSRELLMLAKRRRAEPGEKIITQDAEGHEFFVIVSGTVAVMRDGDYVKSYHAGDYFGETALVLSQPRTADVVARSAVDLWTLDRHGFLYLLRGTDIPTRLMRLARAREARSWELFEQNGALRQLSSAQKTQLQTFLEPIELKAGERLWTRGEPIDAAYLIDAGQVRLEGDGARREPFGSAALLAETSALREGRAHGSSAEVQSAGRAYRIEAADLLRFLDDNPGVSLQLLGSSWFD